VFERVWVRLYGKGMVVKLLSRVTTYLAIFKSIESHVRVSAKPGHEIVVNHKMYL